jgi:hypothetical protein
MILFTYLLGIIIAGVASYLKNKDRNIAVWIGLCWPVIAGWFIIGYIIKMIAEGITPKKTMLSQEFIDWAQKQEDGPDVIGPATPKRKVKMRP